MILYEELIRPGIRSGGKPPSLRWSCGLLSGSIVEVSKKKYGYAPKPEDYETGIYVRIKDIIHEDTRRNPKINDEFVHLIIPVCLRR